MSEYKDKIVAFIDVLGFKNLVKEQDCKTILDIVKNIQETGKHDFSYEAIAKIQNENDTLDKQISVFSDSIIISINHDDTEHQLGIKELLDTISSLQLNLARWQKKFIRGGITFGKIYHEANICYGPAFIKAYELESKVAFYPRVIIDPILQNKYESSFSERSTSYDDWAYLDPIRYPLTILHQILPLKTDQKLSDSTQTILLTAFRIKEAIEDGLNSSNDLSVQAKYAWLAKKFNDFLTPCLKKQEKIYSIFPSNEINYVKI